MLKMIKFSFIIFCDFFIRKTIVFFIRLSDFLLDFKNSLTPSFLVNYGVNNNDLGKGLPKFTEGSLVSDEHNVKHTNPVAEEGLVQGWLVAGASG